MADFEFHQHKPQKVPDVDKKAQFKTNHYNRNYNRNKNIVKQKSGRIRKSSLNA